MQANDAIRILGSAAAMGLLGGGSALAYNAISQPTLDEYGNVIESNDVNPFVTALGGAAVGAVGGYVSNRLQPLRTQMNRPQGMSTGASPQARQSRWEESVPDTDKNPGWNNLDPDAWIEYDRAAPRSQQSNVSDWRSMNDDDFLAFSNDQLWRANDEVGEFYGALNNKEKYAFRERGHGIITARNRAIDVTPRANAQTPIVQIVRANPMKPQNPMSPPGADIVVVPQNPVQKSADELMALQNLALRQSQGTEYFDNSQYGRTFVKASANPIDNYSRREAQLPAIRQVAKDHNQWIAQNQGQQNAAGWDVINPSRQQQERLQYEALMAQKKRA